MMICLSIRPSGPFGLLLPMLFSLAVVNAQLSFDQFEDVSEAYGFGTYYYSWGSAWGDPNGDSIPDLFLTNHFRDKDHNIPLLYTRSGMGFSRDTLPHYDDVTDMHGSAWMDFDDDGDDDLYIVTGKASSNLLLVNDGSGNLENRSDDWQVGLNLSRGRTPIWFDANRDGLLDILVCNGNPLNPVQRNNTLLLREADHFSTSLSDSLSWIGGITGSGAFFGDPWGAGYAQLGLFTDKSVHWLVHNCLPLLQQYRFNATDLEQVISGDFNNDGLSDAYLVRADLSQANASAGYPINFKEIFETHLIDPARTTWIRTPHIGSATLDTVNGLLTYLAAPAYVGMDSLALRVCDSFDNCRPVVVYFDVRPDWVPASGEPISVKADSLLTLDVGKLVHPYRKAMRLILFPRDTLYQEVRFRMDSDSLFLIADPETGLEADSIFIGDSGWHPGNAVRWLLTRTDTFCWGATPFLPGENEGLYIHYDPATDEWVMAYNTTEAHQRLDMFCFTTADVTVTGYLNFSPEAVLSADLLLLSDGYLLQDQTAWAGLDAPNAAVAGTSADFDNDGDLDLFLSCGLLEKNQPNLLWENLGNGQFQPVPGAGNAEGPEGGSAGTPSVVDYDADGFLDLFLENGRGNGSAIRGPYTLLHNRGNANHWLRFRLQGTESPRDGVGAIVEVYRGDARQMRIASGGQNRYAQSERIVHFGMGAAVKADSVIVRWPSGNVQRFKTVDTDQLITIVEQPGRKTSCLPPAFLISEWKESESQMELRWGELPCLEAYQVETRNTETGLTRRYRTDDEIFPLNADSLEREMLYTWKVRGVCSDSSHSNWSRLHEFILPPRPETGLSLVEGDSPLFRLIPNPAGDRVTIACEDCTGSGWQVELNDLSGRLRLQQTCPSASPCTIPLHTLSPGWYTVYVSSENGRTALPLLHERP